MTYLLALDQGTTSSRSIVFDEHGQIRAMAQIPLTQHFPAPGQIEHDPMEIWHTQQQTAQQAIASAGLNPQDISAVGITNQRETTVLWSRLTGQPLARAIVWQDRRTVEQCRVLRDQGHDALIYRKTGLLLDAYFSATKLAWLLDHTPGAREQAARGELAFGTIDSWLTWQLTGGAVHITDYSNASRTLLFDIHALQWDDELLALFNIPRSVLPAVVPSAHVVGLSTQAALGAAVPLAARIGDQQSATVGQACFTPGMAKNTYGTGCFLLMNTGTSPTVSRHRLLTTVGWQLPEDQQSGAAHNNGLTYCLEGSVFMGGATIQWLRDGLGLIESANDVEALAASVPDTGDVILVPALTGLGAPNWDGDARGLMVGMTRGTTKAHIARAALQGIALQVTDVLVAMQGDADTALTELRVDGGASANNLLMQMQADLLGIRVVRPKITETTALGAAYLAGLTIGVWADHHALASHWQVDRVFEPQWSTDQRQGTLNRWQQAVDRAKGWISEKSSNHG